MPGALTWDPTPAGGALSTVRGAVNPTADGASPSVSGGGIAVGASRTALVSDNGATLELSASVTYTLTNEVALPAGVAFQGPVTGSATIAVTGTATFAGGSTTPITVAAGKMATAIPRTSNQAIFLVSVQP